MLNILYPDTLSFRPAEKITETSRRRQILAGQAKKDLPRFGLSFLSFSLKKLQLNTPWVCTCPLTLSTNSFLHLSLSLSLYLTLHHFIPQTLLTSKKFQKLAVSPALIWEYFIIIIIWLGINHQVRFTEVSLVLVRSRVKPPRLIRPKRRRLRLDAPRRGSSTTDASSTQL